jgi:hypothetical protein
MESIQKLLDAPGLMTLGYQTGSNGTFRNTSKHWSVIWNLVVALVSCI